MIASLIVAGVFAFVLGLWIPSASLPDPAAVPLQAPLTRERIEMIQRANLCRDVAPRPGDLAEPAKARPR